MKKLVKIMTLSTLVLTSLGTVQLESKANGNWSEWNQAPCYRGLYVRFRKVNNSKNSSGNVQYWFEFKNTYVDAFQFSYRMWTRKEYEEFVNEHEDAFNHSDYTDHSSVVYVKNQDSHKMWEYLKDGQNILVTVNQGRFKNRTYSSGKYEPCDR